MSGICTEEYGEVCSVLSRQDNLVMEIIFYFIYILNKCDFVCALVCLLLFLDRSLSRITKLLLLHSLLKDVYIMSGLYRAFINRQILDFNVFT